MTLFLSYRSFRNARHYLDQRFLGKWINHVDLTF